MTTLQFTTQIAAPKEKVWATLWNDDSYRQWTSVFTEGSYAESDWQEGSPIRFLGPDGSGMSAIIRKKVDAEEMIFEHRGELKEGREITRDWAGALESYHLTEQDGVTGLTVRMDITEAVRDYFTDTFPKALAAVKELSEQ